MRPRSTFPAGLVAGALLTLVLVVIGELVPGWFPVRISIDHVGGEFIINADGGERRFRATAPGFDRVELRQPGPVEREYQVDGSDLTSRQDRDPEHIRAIMGSPQYRVAAWLRDEDSFSRWENARLIDLADGRVVAEGNSDVQALDRLPANFRLEVGLRRPEAEASLWFVSTSPLDRNGLEINRDRRVMRWLSGERGSNQVGDWYYPEQWQRFAASLVPLVARSMAAGYILLGAALVLGWLLARAPVPKDASSTARFPNAIGWVIATLLLGWLAASTWVVVRLYGQTPHIVDAVSYQLQANIFRAGRLWFEAPPLLRVFSGYHQVTADGRWYSQYAPGAPLAYAAGAFFGIDWLVGSLAGAVMIGATYLAGRFLFGQTIGLIALGLGVMSPFILFQAGAFMSHSIAGAWLALAIATFAYAERSRRLVWYAVTGMLLGAGFATREVAGLLVGLPIGIWLLVHRRLAGVACLAAAALPFLAAYLAYNAATTGDALLLPRHVVDPGDRFGFGQLTSTNRHTVAAGLVNVDMNLTLLQFDLFGWPPLLALSLFWLPFLLGRADRRDVLLAGGILTFIAAHVAYFYHGIALGPRYYFEALPWMLLLAARGLQAVVAALRAAGIPRAPARAAVVAIVSLLGLYSVLYYVPRLVERRNNYVAMPGPRGLTKPFVEPTLAGPRLNSISDEPTLVFVNDERIYKTLFPLNCRLLDRPNIQHCQVLFVRAPLSEAAEISRQYPGRRLLNATIHEGAIALEPYELPNV